MFEKNPTQQRIDAIIRGSRHQAARTLTDTRNGDQWVWPAEFATHREAADKLGVPYDRKPGEGDILVI